MGTGKIACKIACLFTAVTGGCNAKPYHFPKLTLFSGEHDSLLEQVFGQALVAKPAIVPSVDVFENENRYVIWADLLKLTDLIFSYLVLTMLTTSQKPASRFLKVMVTGCA